MITQKIFSTLYKKHSLKTGIEIQCEVEGGVKFPHFSCIKINAEYVGENLTIYHNCTIGDDFKGKPKIGHNVTLGAASMILGNVKIGDNVVIGAMTLVMEDVPDNCVVVGNPARIRKRNH